MLAFAVALSSEAYPAARAIPGPPGGVFDPSNIWEPYGPRTAKLQLNYYSDQNVEFTNFELGKLDYADWPVPKSKWASYDNNPDFVLSKLQGDFSIFQIDFNHESITWASWGCDFLNGNSLCGVQIRQALAHLFDRPRWVSDGPCQGACTTLADPTPPSMTPSGSTLTTQCTWDGLDPGCIGAYNIAPDPGGFASPGSPDFCAARVHLVAAEIGLNDVNNDCVIDGNSPGLANIIANPIKFMIRSDDPLTASMGLGLTNVVKQLFGTDVVAETLGNISQIGDIVFVAAPVSNDWDMYTGSWSLAGPFPDHLRRLYGSIFASNFCGGNPNNRPLNYGFVCIPEYDTHIDAASQTDDLSIFAIETLAALDELGKRVANIPAFSRGVRFVALRDATGLVDQQGAGYPNFWSLLNGRPNPDNTPVNSLYDFGGTGTATDDTLRWGQKQGTTKLNTFHARTPWEFNVLGAIYDVLVRASPIEPEKIIAWMANEYTICIVPDVQCPSGVPGNVVGDTHIIFDLRPNLRWHDGVPLTAEDVRFSILNYRGAPAATLVGAVQLVKDVIVHAPLKVEVILQGKSLSHLPNMAVPIIPRHLWDTDNDGIADPEKLDPSFDPLAAGILIGSGPFVCQSIFPATLGAIGTGCAKSPDGSMSGESIGPGGTLILQRFDFSSSADPFYQYMRSFDSSWPNTVSGQFQEWSWADSNDNSVIDIADLASVASCFGITAPDSTCPADAFAYWDVLGTSGLVTNEVFVVAALFDSAWVAPFPWDTLVNIVPFTPSPPPPAVPQRDPLPLFVYTAEHGFATFDASRSFDPDGVIIDYQWNFGDGTTGKGVRVTQEYGVGVYIVVLTVVDNDGNAMSAQLLVHVSGTGETASPGSPSPLTSLLTSPAITIPASLGATAMAAYLFHGFTGRRARQRTRKGSTQEGRSERKTQSRRGVKNEG